MNSAIAAAEQAGYLGADVCGSGRAFHLEVREAAGAYICGEETSMLESLEGKRGMVRYRPPLPAVKGLFGAPTIVNNLYDARHRADYLRARGRVLPGFRHWPVPRDANGAARR